jgi:hypothetical protein
MLSKISTSIEGSAQCVADVSVNATSLADDVNGVSREMIENQDIADKLYLETEKFMG